MEKQAGGFEQMLQSGKHAIDEINKDRNTQELSENFLQLTIG
jgi:hypothetical protein